jgi:hypothetical protein
MADMTLYIGDYANRASFAAPEGAYYLWRQASPAGERLGL